MKTSSIDLMRFPCAFPICIRCHFSPCCLFIQLNRGLWSTEGRQCTHTTVPSWGTSLLHIPLPHFAYSARIHDEGEYGDLLWVARVWIWDGEYGVVFLSLAFCQYSPYRFSSRVRYLINLTTFSRPLNPRAISENRRNTRIRVVMSTLRDLLNEHIMPFANLLIVSSCLASINYWRL
jgi:hypothetical protein